MPEHTDNERRREIGHALLAHYLTIERDASQNSAEENLTDIIADLLHASATLDNGDQPIDYQAVLRMAATHYETEHDEEDQDADDENDEPERTCACGTHPLGECEICAARGDC